MVTSLCECTAPPVEDHRTPLLHRAWTRTEIRYYTLHVNGIASLQMNSPLPLLTPSPSFVHSRTRLGCSESSTAPNRSRITATRLPWVMLRELRVRSGTASDYFWSVRTALRSPIAFCTCRGGEPVTDLGSGMASRRLTVNWGIWYCVRKCFEILGIRKSLEREGRTPRPPHHAMIRNP